MGLALQNSPGVLPALAVFHVLSLPVMPTYCADWAWRIRPCRSRSARPRPEGPSSALVPDYWLKEVIDKNVPQGTDAYSRSGPGPRPISTAASWSATSPRSATVRVSSLGKTSTADLKPMGIEFLLLNDTDFGAADIEQNMNSSAANSH